MVATHGLVRDGWTHTTTVDGLACPCRALPLHFPICSISHLCRASQDRWQTKQTSAPRLAGSGRRLYRRLATRFPLHPGHGGSTSGFRSLFWALDPVMAARCCVAAGLDYLAGPCLACPGSLRLDQRSLLIHPFQLLAVDPHTCLGVTAPKPTSSVG
jgi:hypothetical protein